ncbi:MAG: sugar phosphate isomerase/epimerase [Firmicutes bacterium]|nr:sugar phosphate isomerase/epimerase [Bacillota bacterium]
MKIGFRSEATTRELEIARRVGIEVIELGWYPHTRPQETEIGKRLREYGIGVSALLTGDEPVAPQLIADLEATARFGARAFVSHPHPIDPGDAVACRKFQDTFGPACDYAEKLGVALAVHSCGLDPTQWELMFSLVPKLRLKYDPSFSLEAGRNYLAEILKYGRRIVHVHVKDERFMGRDTNFTDGIMHYQYSPAGTGDINWGAVIALLYEVGYQGDLAIETHSRFWWDHLEWDLILGRRHLSQFIVD